MVTNGRADVFDEKKTAVSKQQVAHYLGYAGLLPFALVPACRLLGLEPFALSLELVFLVYALMIVSFLAGVQWGIYLLRDAPLNLFVQSNFVVVIAWIAFGFLPSYCLPVLLACFVYLLWIDRRLHLCGVLDSQYIRLRTKVTILVVMLLLIELVMTSV